MYPYLYIYIYVTAHTGNYILALQKGKKNLTVFMFLHDFEYLTVSIVSAVVFVPHVKSMNSTEDEKISSSWPFSYL